MTHPPRPTTHPPPTGAAAGGGAAFRIPARRWGTGGDFGGIAVYPMSDASAYHTGDGPVIDGGCSLF